MLILLLILNTQLHEQTDWMGGDGLKGPVTDWGTRYYTSDSITTATEGQASLVANSWDYTSSGWIRHDLDTNYQIAQHTQGFMPGNINGDNLLDLVAYVVDSIWWYQNNGNWNYIKHLVGRAVAGSSDAPCVYVADMDGDKDDDVLVATASVGLGWFENQNSGNTWVYHSIVSGSYHRVCVADVDRDDDMDVIAVDNARSVQRGNIYLFRRTGATTFSKETIKQFQFFDPDQAWRVYTADFNNDKYPDIYAVGGHAYVFLNRGTGGPGQFDQTYWRSDMGGNPNVDWDGAWAVDINMDGWMDLVTADQQDSLSGHPYGFYGHINNGTGGNYTVELLTSTPQGEYTDGSIARDLDLNGLPDIIGTYHKVGWFRRGPVDVFQEYLIDDVMQQRWAHWAYTAELDPECVPDVDLLITDKGAHIIYENNMLKGFADSGYLESSILKLGTVGSPYTKLLYFGWDACVPDSTTLKLYWRTTTDTIGDSILSKAWNGPYYTVSSAESISLPEVPCPKFFQYKVEFSPTVNDSEIAALYRVWMRDTICVNAIEEQKLTGNKTWIKITSENKILLSVAQKVDNAELSVYNSAGQKVSVLYKGLMDVREYTFVPRLKAKGVYLIILSSKNNYNQQVITVAKLVKYN
ncbi:MAG: VCBS repeat-containing protein [bacterium]|nr:VCBS repeat-containing protein [bacterium]